MNWTKDQQKIIDVRNNNVLVSAAAGSGKTAVLVERIIRMIFDKENPVNVEEFLVVTFTNAAAAQMKEKIAKAIEEKLKQEPDNEYYIRQLNMVGQANILTIDSFCYKIVKEYFHVLGIDPKIQIAEETDIAILQQNILESVIEKAYQNNPDFADFSNAYSSDKNDLVLEEYILKLYNLSQCYSYPDRWLDEAKNNLHVENEKMFNDLPVMPLFYREIRNQAECIRKIMLRQLERVRGIDGPKHYESAILSDIVLADTIIASKKYSQFAGKEIKFEAFKRAKKDSEFDKDMAEEIKNVRDKYKDSIRKLLAPFSLSENEVIEQYKCQEKMLSALVDVTKEFSEVFFAAKLAEGVIGFSDIEHLALKVLCEGKDENGNPIPTKAAIELSDQFKEILIDEYQDSNYLQEDILKCVSGIYKGNNNMFMVGDVKQSIYAFRMARPDLFINKYNVFDYITDDDDASVSTSGVKILLKNNFRSRDNVLKGINYIFYQLMREEIGGINYGEEEALVPGKKYSVSDDDNVEILIGESKKVDYLEVVGETENDSDSHLDDEYVDVESVELEASMIAKRIRKLMGLDGNSRFLIDDDDIEKTQRPLDYRDIVILLRSPKSYQEVFSEILKGQNIPVKVQNENGYFDTVEIKTILSLLRVIDNPLDNVEYIALLRGFFGEFNSDELAVLSIMMRGKEYYYDLVKSFVDNPDLYNEICIDAGVDKMLLDSSVLYKKCIYVSNLIEYYQEKIRLYSISELLSDIYYNTGYYYYVEAMPEGKARSRNLNLLLDETKKFEKGGFRSLFDFLQFVKKLSEKNVSLGGDPSIDDVDNVVRIMSAHKSKGLEFPVVFVAGTGKQFNTMDSKSPIIMHSDYYIAAKYINNKKRYGSDTFSRRAMVSLINAESIAEELRILYVAMTRAKEKLIITGVTSDITKLIKKYRDVVEASDVKLDYSVIRNASNYLELIVAAMMRNSTFHEAMSEVRQRYDNRGNLVSGYYELKNDISDPKVKFSVDFFDFQSLVISRIMTGEEEGNLRMNKIKELEKKPSKYLKKLETNLSWIYEDKQYTNERSKMSVTEIKRRYEEEDDTFTDIYVLTEKDSTSKIIPKFVSDIKAMDAAEKGTWIHRAMELIDFKKIDSMSSVTNELQRLYSDGCLPPETKDFIRADKILAFAESELGKRMRTADALGMLQKEKKFIVGVPISEKDDVPDVVVQGIIDVFFEEDDYLVLVDYKTDKIKPGQEIKLIDRYKTQMQYYKDTLEQITGKQVKEIYLYSFALDKPVKL